MLPASGRKGTWDFRFLDLEMELKEIIRLEKEKKDMKNPTNPRSTFPSKISLVFTS
jgi:hypothetical protein